MAMKKVGVIGVTSSTNKADDLIEWKGMGW